MKKFFTCMLLAVVTLTCFWRCRMLNLNNALCNKRKTQRAFFIFVQLD